jgi:hypothetical protein
MWSEPSHTSKADLLALVNDLYRCPLIGANDSSPKKVEEQSNSLLGPEVLV